MVMKYDYKQTVARIVDLEKNIGIGKLLDPQGCIFDWHRTVVFRMNYYLALVEQIEQKHERIGLDFTQDPMWVMWHREYTNYYEYWMMSTSTVVEYKELCQLQEDLQTFKEHQDPLTRQYINCLKDNTKELTLFPDENLNL